MREDSDLVSGGVRAYLKDLRHAETTPVAHHNGHAVRELFDTRGLVEEGIRCHCGSGHLERIDQYRVILLRVFFAVKECCHSVGKHFISVHAIEANRDISRFTIYMEGEEPIGNVHRTSKYGSHGLSWKTKRSWMTKSQSLRLCCCTEGERGA